jgi:ribA/ribD-fused uncharacterized protein
MTTKIIETIDLIVFTGDIYTQWLKTKFIIDGITFNCCEQWMMYNKAKHFGDNKIAELILLSNNPKEQKQLGRSVQNFNDKQWLLVCDDFVYYGNLAKFQQNPKLYKKILETGDKIIAEGSCYDKRWGTGLNILDTINTPMSKWGENKLGKALMKVRTTLRNIKNL